MEFFLGKPILGVAAAADISADATRWATAACRSARLASTIAGDAPAGDADGGARAGNGAAGGGGASGAAAPRTVAGMVGGGRTL